MALNDIMGLLGRAGEVIGGGTPGLYGGLLSEEELRQAKSKASTKALFDLSASLAEAARPQSGRPIGTFGAIAKGLSAAQQGYQGTLQQQAKEKLAMQEMQRQMQAKQRADQAQALGGRLFTQATPAQPAPYLAGAPYGKATPAQPGGINQEVLAQLRASPEGRAVLAEIQKTTTPEYKVVGDRLFKMPTLGMGTPEDVGGADKSTNAYKDFLKAKDEGFKGSFMDYQLGLKKAGASSMSVNLPSESERKSATLASRMNFSVGQMMDAVGKDPSAAKPDTIAEAARFLSQSDWLPNKLNSEQRQIVEAAQEDILDAALTLGTGAAYTREQLAGYKKAYFPQIGDTDATVRTKQARLQNLLETAQLAAGRAAKDIPASIPTGQPSIADISLSDLIAERQRRAGKK